MPPAGKLDDRIIADFETWVRAGAVDPRWGPVARIAQARHRAPGAGGPELGPPARCVGRSSLKRPRQS